MAGFERSPAELADVEPNELFRRAQGGCPDSSAELSRRFRPRLLNLLTEQLGCQYSDAEDIAQEALSRAFQRFDRFDPRYQFSTWLYTIAVRLAHDHARSVQRRPRQVALDEFDCSVSESSIARLAEQEEIGNLWQTAKRVLSKDQYRAMWLRYAEDQSTVEVAKLMHKSRIGVRVLLHRARLALVAEVGKPKSSPSSPVSDKRGHE